MPGFSLVPRRKGSPPFLRVGQPPHSPTGDDIPRPTGLAGWMSALSSPSSSLNRSLALAPISPCLSEASDFLSEGIYGRHRRSSPYVVSASSARAHARARAETIAIIAQQGRRPLRVQSFGSALPHPSFRPRSRAAAPPAAADAHLAGDRKKEQRSAASAARAVMAGPSTQRPAALNDGVLLSLAALVGKTCAHAKRAIGSGQSAALPLGAAPSSDTVHHFWSEGLAITAVADLVDEIEIFGDSHPFHQRALGQQLMPGISFGAERVQVEAVLGSPIGEGPGGAHASVGRWLFYGPWVLETGYFWSRKKTTVTLALFFEENKGETPTAAAALGVAGRADPSSHSGVAGRADPSSHSGVAGRADPSPNSVSDSHVHLPANAPVRPSLRAGGEAAPGAATAAEGGGSGATLCGLQAVRILQCNDRLEWCRKHSVSSVMPPSAAATPRTSASAAATSPPAAAPPAAAVSLHPPPQPQDAAQPSHLTAQPVLSPATAAHTPDASPSVAPASPAAASSSTASSVAPSAAASANPTRRQSPFPSRTSSRTHSRKQSRDGFHPPKQNTSPHGTPAGSAPPAPPASPAAPAAGSRPPSLKSASCSLLFSSSSSIAIAPTNRSKNSSTDALAANSPRPTPAAPYGFIDENSAAESSAAENGAGVTNSQGGAGGAGGVKEAGVEEAGVNDRDVDVGAAAREEWEQAEARRKQWRWLRNRRYDAANHAVIQVAGHSGMFHRLSESVLVKQGTSGELAAYQGIAGSALQDFVPKCLHSVRQGDVHLLYIEDLTARYIRPCVMDIKIGTRTFLEADVASPHRRIDLMRKIEAVDPNALTDDERAFGVTKLRYMKFREVTSSTATLGWRVEGIRRSHAAGSVLTFQGAKTLQAQSELEAALRWFCQGREAVRGAFTRRLEALQMALEQSAWFRSNELVSSSLLFLYDDSHLSNTTPGLWMIDFAKTAALAPGATLTHRTPWTPGNREDGYLTGVDSLLDVFRGLPLGPPETARLVGAAERVADGDRPPPLSEPSLIDNF